MTEFEKITTALKCCQRIASNCIDCPYNEYFGTSHDCEIKLHNDAYTMLTQMLKDKEKDCPICKGREVCTEDDLYDVRMVKITPLPAVNLTTGEKEGTGKPPYYALKIGCDDQSADYLPIEYCPWCGRKLQEET